MNARPILFSAPMIWALLDRAKTQNRLVVKPQSMFDGSDAAVARQPRQRGRPYGAPGDLLWVREGFRLCAEADGIPQRDSDAAYRIWYEADAPHQHGAGKLRPAIHMPRWASRLTLRITDVRVQRLQEISEDDARAEGVRSNHNTLAETGFANNKDAFRALWAQINGQESWDANPFVWALTFDVLHGNVDDWVWVLK